MSTTKVALAGATGNLGMPMLKGLLAADFKVTVLSRKGGNSSKLPSHPNLAIQEVDFTSADSITPALKDVEVVVSCVATLAMGSQNPLIDASISAGVKRFIPAEFGMDPHNPLTKALPVIVPKTDTQKYLNDQVRLNPWFSWTGIANGLFLDWCLELGLIVDPAHHTATLYNGGDVPFSSTTLGDIARAVIGVIRNQDETANRVVYVHSTVTTQNQLIRYAKEKDGKEWNVTEKTTEELRRESLEIYEKGDENTVMDAMNGFSLVGMFDSDYGCDFSGHLDNDLLGLKVMNEMEVRGLVEKLL